MAEREEDTQDQDISVQKSDFRKMDMAATFFLITKDPSDEYEIYLNMDPLNDDEEFIDGTDYTRKRMKNRIETWREENETANAEQTREEIDSNAREILGDLKTSLKCVGDWTIKPTELVEDEAAYSKRVLSKVTKWWSQSG